MASFWSYSLNEAIRNDDSKTFNSILRRFANQDVRDQLTLDRDGYSPLHVAVIHQRLEMLEQLLQLKCALGLDVNIRSNTEKESWTAWQYAVRDNYKEGKLLLVQYDCDTSHAEEPKDQYHQLNPPKGKYSSSKICEEAVNSIYDKVVNGLYASAVIPQLVKQGVLTSEDVDLILSQETKSEKTMRLLTILPRKGTDDYSYRVLFSALRNDNENLPHHNLGEELHEICQRLMEEEQKKQYAERRKLMRGSGPTPTTLDSTGRSSSFSQPDSGFRSRPRTPLGSSSGDLSSDGHKQGRQRKESMGRSIRNHLASDFNSPLVTGLQGQERKYYPAISSVIKPKTPLNGGGERKEEEEEREVGTRVLNLQQCRNPFAIPQLSAVIEDDHQVHSDTEKDGAQLVPEQNCRHHGRKSHKKHHRQKLSHEHWTDSEHRPLIQIMEIPSSSNEPQKLLHTHRINVCPKQHTFFDTSNLQSSPPITIPSSSGSSSSDQSSSGVSALTSTSSSGEPESTQRERSSVASEPKVLHSPQSKWERFKSFIWSNL